MFRLGHSLFKAGYGSGPLQCLGPSWVIKPSAPNVGARSNKPGRELFESRVTDSHLLYTQYIKYRPLIT